MTDVEKGVRPMDSILITDCGSTTTKAILIEKGANGFRMTARGEAPTTVESPHEDVTMGVLNAIEEVEESTGRKRLRDGRILSPRQGGEGVDIYLSTSSAGGGLQMMVAGVVKNMTAQSAARAALGAGAIVMDVLASNDGRLPHERVTRIRNLRPDMILLSGGVDGGTVTHVLEMAELLKASHPKPRLGMTFKLPVIYAGNRDAAKEVERILGEATDLDQVQNVRPVLERENLQPAREKIHDLFMEHVMAQAPGYKKLMSWAHAPIMPTPGAVGSLIKTVAEKEGLDLLCVDIGGATTDVFSVFSGVFNRTVSANLGMSYSVSNVLAEAGYENIARWLPFEMNKQTLRNRIGNKMIRPTTIPQSLDDLKLEQAIAREALRLSFLQHETFAVGLSGVQAERSVSDTFAQENRAQSLVNMMDLNLLIGSGGVLSHAPRRAQAARMMIDAFLPEGITELAVDSVFMMPHLGILSKMNEAAAAEVFHKDCLVRLGTCVAPRGKGKRGKTCLKVSLLYPDGSRVEKDLRHGELVCLPLEPGRTAEARLVPRRGMDIGAGPGNPKETRLAGGAVGLILDGRGRAPFEVPQDPAKRVDLLKEWSAAFQEYPDHQGVD